MFIKINADIPFSPSCLELWNDTVPCGNKNKHFNFFLSDGDLMYQYRTKLNSRISLYSFLT